MTTIEPTKPTILIAHGSWHLPLHYAPLQNIFKAAGYPSVCPRQATADALPPTGLAEDVAIIQAELDKLIVEEGREVIVIGHSYGGMLITESIKESYSKKSREAQGLKGGVIHLVYLCAFFIRPGLSIYETFNKQLPPWSVTTPNGQCHPENPGPLFYPDVPESERQHWVDEIVPIPQRCQTDVQEHTAYLYHPSTYVYCENDVALPFELQKLMVNLVVEATGLTIRDEYLPASHSPFLSMPERVLGVVEKVALGV